MLYELLEFNGSRFANGSVMPSLYVRDAVQREIAEGIKISAWNSLNLQLLIRGSYVSGSVPGIWECSHGHNNTVTDKI